MCVKDCVTWLSIRNCEVVVLIESQGYIDLIHSSLSICLPSSLSLSPFTVMEYFIDILGVWGRAMTPQLFHPFERHRIQ